MCKCEIGKCAHAESKLLDGKIRCSVRGETVALKRCSDYVPFVVTNENIKNKFPEINHFIEKPKDYELLYYQGDKIHNEYPLEVEEAKAIFNYIDYLESKCKKQKEVIDKANKYLHARGIQRWSNGTHYRGLDGLQTQVLENILNGEYYDEYKES